MGNFYVNYALFNCSQEQAIDALSQRQAIITPEENGCVLVGDQESDSQDSEIITELATSLSNKLSGPVLAALNHDDDILWLLLVENGVVVDEYNSTPDYFEGDPPDAEEMEQMMAQLRNGTLETPPRKPPQGGDARTICRVLKRGKVEEIEKVLQSTQGVSDYVFAVDRHADLAKALDLPKWCTGISYSYFQDGMNPEGLQPNQVVTTR